MRALKNAFVCVVLLTGYAAAANAYTTTNQGLGTATIQVTQPTTPVTVTLTPASGLTAGNVNSLTVMNGTVSLPAGFSSSKIALRWTPGTIKPVISDSTLSDQVLIFDGPVDYSNTKNLVLSTVGLDAFSKTADNIWTVSNDVLNSVSFHQTASGLIKAGNYNASIDAAVYEQ